MLLVITTILMRRPHPTTSWSIENELHIMFCGLFILFCRFCFIDSFYILILIFCFILFCFWKVRKTEIMNLSGEGSGKDLGGFEEGENMIKNIL